MANNDTVPHRHCGKCGGEVRRETEHTEAEYPYFCPECDENLFEFETYLDNKED